MATNHTVTPLARSKSNRIYVFEDTDGSLPPLAHILMIDKGDAPAMAFVVIKHYAESRQFAARRVREYGGLAEIETGETYSAIAGPTEGAPIERSAQDRDDLQELERGTQSAVEADAATELPDLASIEEPEGHAQRKTSAPASNEAPRKRTSGRELPPLDDQLSQEQLSAPEPQPEQEKVREREPEEAKEEDQHQDHQGIPEVRPFSPKGQGISGEFAMFNALRADGEQEFFAGAGARYALTLAHQIFFKSTRAQDSLALEGGVFLYRIVDYEVAGDAYAILPLIGTVRYNLFFNESFGIFAYLGLLRAEATQTAGDDNEYALDNLSIYSPVGGGGAMLQIAPGWFLRADAGLDSIGLGLMLSF